MARRKNNVLREVEMALGVMCIVACLIARADNFLGLCLRGRPSRKNASMSCCAREMRNINDSRQRGLHSPALFMAYEISCLARHHRIIIKHARRRLLGSPSLPGIIPEMTAMSLCALVASMPGMRAAVK